MNTRSLAYRNEVIRKLHAGCSIVFIDVETTGISDKDEIVQFAGIRYFYQKKPFSLCETERMNIYIRPSCKIKDSTKERHGITEEFLSDMTTAEEAFAFVKKFLDNSNLVAAYGCEFKKKVLHIFYKQNNGSFPKVQFIDVLEMARDCFLPNEIPSYSLPNVVKFVGGEGGLRLNSALDDAIATRRVFMACLNRYLQSFFTEKKKEKCRMAYCYYWENPKQKSMRRVVVDTSLGRVYYDIVKKNWGVNKGNGIDINEIDLEELEKQCLTRYQCQSMDELTKFLRVKKRS